ncbi:(d)CMP kinase [Desulfotomaculum copahuensis]|uniref:Cytidylate kinase n=1 Tax=Desulfotomaculum copahuensis TaxID=1838280 RepID=A0A1B7LIM4_9FIRM|nr:(d)CMP kinase [Desulfotomaculum copahuensis]OAT86414.1 cytidylate kinase [Desulfotomaculum copahuensis]
MTGKISIAIDGPAGAGKSTVAREVARRLGLLYIDTGAMYRALTLTAIQQGVDLSDRAALTELAQKTVIRLDAGSGGETRVWADGRDVTGRIRDQAVTRLVSLVAGVPGVRKEMVRRQREMAAGGGVVMEGRDIGTVVLPEAQVKIFLTASVEARAARRRAELAAGGVNVDRDELIRAIARRDELDSTRAADPLRPAAGAVIIDCSALSAPEVVALVLAQAAGRDG